MSSQRQKGSIGVDQALYQHSASENKKCDPAAFRKVVADPPSQKWFPEHDQANCHSQAEELQELRRKKEFVANPGGPEVPRCETSVRSTGSRSQR